MTKTRRIDANRAAKILGVSRMTITNRMKDDPAFPAPVKDLGMQRWTWTEDEIRRYLYRTKFLQKSADAIQVYASAKGLQPTIRKACLLTEELIGDLRIDPAIRAKLADCLFALLEANRFMLAVRPMTEDGFTLLVNLLGSVQDAGDNPAALKTLSAFLGEKP